MERVKLESLSAVLKWCLQITFVVGVLVTAFLSQLLRLFYSWHGIYDPTRYKLLLIILTPSGICSLIILWQLTVIVKSIGQKDPFVHKNVKCFHTIAVACFLIFVFFAVLFSQYPSVFTFALSYVFLVMGLASLVFGKLFQKAVDYKRENDLTI